MKKKLILATTVMVLTIIACRSEKQIAYELPEAMLPHVKAEYKMLCAKGKILYDMNCAGCHNTTVGKREVIPDFNEAELKGYALRVSNRKHESSMPDSLVTEEDLGVIMTFLRYKKKR